MSDADDAFRKIAPPKLRALVVLTLLFCILLDAPVLYFVGYWMTVISTALCFAALATIVSGRWRKYRRLTVAAALIGHALASAYTLWAALPKIERDPEVSRGVPVSLVVNILIPLSVGLFVMFAASWRNAGNAFDQTS